MSKIRVGLIGCGGNASGHLERVMEMPYGILLRNGARAG